jgi:hypothetical protein
MYDANLVDFYGRVARFEKARAKGQMHEAAGTIGGSTYTIARRRGKLRITPFLLVVLCAFALKGAIYNAVGADPYQTRVERLNAGEGFDRFGGWLMQADPVTLFVADKIAAAKIALKS